MRRNNLYIGILEAGLQSSNKKPMYGLVRPSQGRSGKGFSRKDSKILVSSLCLLRMMANRERTTVGV